MNKKLRQTDQEVVIDSHDAFNTWRKKLRTIPIIGSSKFYRMSLPELSESENQNISDLITAYHGECGCRTGSFFMSIAFCAPVVCYFVSGGTISTIHFQQIAGLGAITLLGALGGKLFGLLRARWKLIRLADSIQDRVNTDNSQQSSFH